MKVLIVDDNESITEVIKDFFEFENIECKTINDSQDGLNEIKNSNYDLILLDIAMPNFTGLDILDELKRQKIEHKNIIIFTASVFKSELINEFHEVGVKEVLSKPISIEKMDQIRIKYLK
ncbi:response regulator [Candidatus Nitrosocosmicus hydrocola]|uniref:response regulator n=1 Tax=Candidatus Nitrosocosmicus hydrocola TaxID=1826872 RepID=UPI0011E5A6B4|nr:response regulator [Candidatus Nitrosocosmicus hydrocola]